MSKITKQISLYALLIITLALVFGTPLLSLAACTDNGYCIITTIPGTEIKMGDSVKGSGLTLAKYIQQIYIFSLGIVGLIAVAAIVYWSFTYIISAGNPSKMSDAMGGIKDAVLGLIILLLATLILNFINPNLTKLNPFDSLADQLNENKVVEAPIPQSIWIQKSTGAMRIEDANFNCSFFGKIDSGSCDASAELAPKNSVSPGSNICCVERSAPRDDLVGPPDPSLEGPPAP
ncbi:MAG: hypothetical protein Q8L47_04270 [bacterium]|nr:hypothetical protein [bacterium]